MNKLIAYFVKQGVFVNLITVFVVVSGIYSLMTINREVFPNITFDIITISTPYPGASAESVEKLITSPLEQDLKEVDGIKRLTSVSTEGRSVIVMQLDPDQTSEAAAEADIQDVVDAFTDLPEGAEDPQVTSIESKQRPVIEVSLSGDVEEETLRSSAKRLEKVINRIPGVAKVNFSGMRDYEVKVLAKPENLRKFNVTLQDIFNTLQSNNINIPGGILETNSNRDYEMIVRTVGEFETAEDVENAVIRANTFAKPIRIKDVATVVWDFEKETIRFKTDGKKSMSLTVAKKERSDDIEITKKIREAVDNHAKLLPEGISVDYINDLSFLINRRISILSNNFTVGLALVLIVLSFVLPVRVALVTAFGIPFAFLGAMLYFDLAGVSINLISLMGLIIVVGMLVDDAVVITENAQRHIEDGETPEQGAIIGTQEVWAPVTASVLTTVMAFAPLMFMSGIFGKFVKYIPIGVIAALLISLWECYFILPHHISLWVKKSKKRPRRFSFANLWENKLTPLYVATVSKVLKLRYIVLICTTAFFIGSIVFAVTKMNFVLFPRGGIEVFIINLESPTGTAMDKMIRMVKPIEDEIAKLPDNELDNFTTKIGLQRVNFDDPNVKRGPEYAQIMVYLTPESRRTRKAQDIIDAMRESFGNTEGFTKINFEQMSGGPPVGKPVNVGVRGDRYEQILPAIDALHEIVKSIPGVTDTESTYIKGKKELHVIINDTEAAAAELNFNNIGLLVRAAFDGLVPTSIRQLEEEIDIRVSLDQETRADQKALGDIMIPNMRGFQIPLKRVATIKESQGIATYEHEEGLRQVRIIGEVDSSVSNSRAVKAIIAERLPQLQEKFPAVSFHFGGEASDTEESMASLRQAFIYAISGIMLLLILLFKNLYQPLIVASTIPLGIASIIWTFYFHAKPLSFMAIIGVIALSGVVINNAIVFVDFVNASRKKGDDRFQSIASAASKRLRPIFLTTVTTVAGILPTAYGIGGKDPFVVPVALALGWGMLAGSILTTIALPAHLAIMDDIIASLRWVKKQFI